MTDDRPTEERTENREHTERADAERARPSRRRVLQAAAAAGALPGLAHAGVGAQETTTEGGDQTTAAGEDAGFFQEGTEVGVREVAGGMTAPTDFAQPDGDDRYFVTDQTGEVWVVTSDGRRDEPFADVGDRMVELGEFAGTYASQGQDYDERGLLGIAFHPEFQDNDRLYLHYSAPRTDDMPENWDHREIVSEFRTTDGGESADPESERVLLDIPHPQYNHDAGPIAFGPDGYLYVPMGDGGGANDNMYGHVEDWYDGNEGGNGQDVTENLLGNVLRIDVDGGAEATTQAGDETATREGGDRPYAIPEDNPFAGDGEGREEIYAWGLRNPYGIDFDSDGRLFTADLGQNLFEEVDIIERGGNYGWNVREGTHCFDAADPTDPPDECPTGTPDDVRDGEQLVEPVAEYPHTYRDSVVGIAIVGGHFYEEGSVSDLQGKYVFGDWTQDPARNEPAGRLLAATPRNGQDEAETLTETDGDGETATEAGDETATDAETTAGNGTATDAETPAGKTATEEPAGPEAGSDDQVVPREDLWEMEELVVQGEFDYFVRQFGQDADGDLYVLVGTEGVPQGDGGAVLQLVPPGEGDDGSDATTEAGDDTATTEAAGEETTEAGDDTATTEAAGEETTEGGETTTEA